MRLARGGEVGFRGLCALALVLLAGCAALEIHGPLPCVRERCRETLKVAIAAFQDDRPVVEYGSPPPRPYPVAEDLVEEMSVELARQLVADLNDTHFFRTASLVEGSGSPPSAELLARLLSQGYDAVITGNVPRCLGSTCVLGGDLAGHIMLRLVSLVAHVPFFLPLAQYHNEGVVTVEDVRLTDTRTGDVVWRGGEFTKQVVRYTNEPSPAPAIGEAMIAVSKAIIEDMQAHLRSGMQSPFDGDAPRP